MHFVARHTTARHDMPRWHCNGCNVRPATVAMCGRAADAAGWNQTRVIIIIMLPNQAIASTPSAPRPSGAEGIGSTAPLCLQLLRTSQACTRYSAILLEITRHLPLLPQISSDTKRNNLVEASGNQTRVIHVLAAELLPAMSLQKPARQSPQCCWLLVHWQPLPEVLCRSQSRVTEQNTEVA
jgi:hypothetical protein